MNELYVIEQAAEQFRALAGMTGPGPYNVEEMIIWAVPVEIRRLPALSVNHIHHWAAQHGVRYRFSEKNRRLRGCLISYGDHGVIFLDALDPEDEQRFTLAHELAHFMLDYYNPRQHAIEVFGDVIRQVLDGLRPPSLTERMHAVLADVPLGVVAHLMERPATGLPDALVVDVEARADRLALELTAPAAEVLERVNSAPAPKSFRTRRVFLTSLLTDTYRLPESIANSYARTLLQSNGGPSVRDWLLGTD